MASSQKIGHMPSSKSVAAVYALPDDAEIYFATFATDFTDLIYVGKTLTDIRTWEIPIYKHEKSSSKSSKWPSTPCTTP